VIIFSFHLDHCGALPYLLSKTYFKGEVYMTHPTKAIYKLLLSDYVKITSKKNPLFNKEDLNNSMDKIKLIDYH